MYVRWLARSRMSLGGVLSELFLRRILSTSFQQAFLKMEVVPMRKRSKAAACVKHFLDVQQIQHTPKLEGGSVPTDSVRTKCDNVLAAYVRSALEQWKYSWPLLQDRMKGTKIIYSVDTDVITLFTNPLEVAPETSQGRPGYLQLFVDDKKEECIARGRVVADYIFRNLSEENVPLLIFPPLTQELEIIHNAVARKAHDQQFCAYKELRDLKEKFDVIRDSGNIEKLYGSIKENTPQLILLIEGEGDATAELRRFSILFRDRLVAAPSFFVEQRILNDEILSALVPAGINLARDVELFQFREKWARELQGAPKKAQKHRDISVLARIQLINRLLPDGLKLVHITGDVHILAAGDRIMISDESNFTDCYLRHPRAFLSQPGILVLEGVDNGPDENVLQTETGEPAFSEFAKWLIVFLAKFWEKSTSEIYDSIKRDTTQLTFDIDEPDILRFCHYFPQLVSTFRERWDEFSLQLTTDHAHKIVDSMPYMRALSGNLKASFEEIEEKISQYTQETWRATFQSVLATSYGMTRIGVEHSSSGGIVRSRSVPLISCQSFPKTQDFIREIIEAKSLNKMGEKKYSELLETIKSEDTVGYSYDLAYATLFAAEGRWALAKILAERSFRLRLNTREARISGREAAYYCAVAIRNTARSVRDLKVAEKWIGTAKECYEKDRKELHSKPAGEFRFDVELASLSLAALFFKFSFGRRPAKSNVPELRSVEKKFQRLFVLIQEKLGKEVGSSDWVDQHETWINRNLERKVLVNLLMIRIIREFSYDEEFGKEDIQKTKRYFDLLSEVFKVDVYPQLNTSYLYDVIWKLASLRFVKDKRSIRDAKKELETELLTNHSIERHCVMPYDRSRLEFFREIVGKVAQKSY